MIVSDLDTMERIVKRNRSLRWDGWDVLRIARVHNPSLAQSSKFGLRLNGVWVMAKRYKPGRQGWNIPDEFLKA